MRKSSQHAKAIGVGTIATIVGRYYAMDRDKRWDRVAQAYNAPGVGRGNRARDAVDAVRQWYAAEKTDEFIPPTIIRRRAADAERPSDSRR